MTSPTVVLIHGAFADASGYAAIIQNLEADGLTVFAPPNPLRSLSIDADTVRAFVAEIEGDVVLVGHSYGGAVITQASASLPNVKALVYLAAFGIDVGEDCLSVQGKYAPSKLATTARPSSYDSIGSPGGPELHIDYASFHDTFCADLPADVAAVMAATQRPVAAASLSEPATAAGWKTIPSWYLVCEGDNAINPELEKFFAERMGATTGTSSGSHVAFIAQPEQSTELIKKAVASLG